MKRSKCITYFGATFDQNLSPKFVTQGLEMSHIDQTNSVQYGLPKCEILKLQRRPLQDITAKPVLQRHKYDSSTHARKIYTGCQLKPEFN